MIFILILMGIVVKWWNFYAEVFGTEAPKIMTFGETPPNPEYPLPEEAKELVMHTRLNISGSNVMFSDVFPGMPFIEGNNISLAFVSTDQDEIKSVFSKLKEGGKVGHGTSRNILEQMLRPNNGQVWN